MKTQFKFAVYAASIAVLTGCATVNFDDAINTANQSAGSFTGGKLELSRSAEQNAARSKLASELLSTPLSSNDAVQL